MPKDVQTTTQLHLSHTLAKKCSKFSRPGFNSTWTVNFQICKLDLEKAENQRSYCHHPFYHWKSMKVPEKKKSTSFLLTTPKPLTVWITANYGKTLKIWECQATWLVCWKICMQVKKQQLELGMEQQTASKSGKEYIKAVYCQPAYLTSIQSTSCEMLG